MTDVCRIFQITQKAKLNKTKKTQKDIAATTHIIVALQPAIAANHHLSALIQSG